MNEQEKIKTIKIKVENEVSSTFCLAKWHHVTMYLQTGETHSCYHPAPHKIPLLDVFETPSALHNTAHKKQERKMMLEGKRPSECSAPGGVRLVSQPTCVWHKGMHTHSLSLQSGRNSGEDSFCRRWFAAAGDTLFKLPLSQCMHYC